MKALVVEGPKKASIQEKSYPEPGTGEIIIKVKRCGVCGTDFHIYEGAFLSPYPLTPGHEFAGIVDAVGEGVTGFRPGDRVAADPSLFCGKCTYCLSDRGNHCVHWGAIGDTIDGAFAEYVRVPSENVFHLPDVLSFADGAFIEPVACVVHGMNQLRLKAGQSVVLFGAGSMGQLLTQALARTGAGELVVVDVDPMKLELALEHGATKGILSRDVDQLLANRKDHAGFDVVVDVTGIPQVIQQEFQYVAPAGTFLQFGVAPPNATVSVNPFDIYHKDLRIIGSMAINHTYKAALDWISAGRFDLSYLVTREISVDEMPQFLTGGKASDVLKVQVTFE